MIRVLIDFSSMTSIVEKKHYGDPVFTSRCDSWGFWSHLFDLSELDMEETLMRILNKHDRPGREWDGHTLKSHARTTRDGRVVHSQSRTLLRLPRGKTYDTKRYQVSTRTVYYFVEYGVVRDLVPGCGQRLCVSPEHQILRPYTTV
jgi:hypothetical protein